MIIGDGELFDSEIPAEARPTALIAAFFRYLAGTLLGRFSGGRALWTRCGTNDLWASSGGFGKTRCHPPGSQHHEISASTPNLLRRSGPAHATPPSLGDAMFSVTGKVKNISNDTSTAFIHFKFIGQIRRGHWQRAMQLR
jgi:hypothetical protein